MFRALILTFALIFGVFANAEESNQQEFGLGIAMESRVQRDVNPDLGTLRNLGGVFLKYRLSSWALMLEATQEQRDSNSGSLNVRSESTMTSLWGRYEFANGERAWRAYLGLGAGIYFDKVKTTFQNSEATNSGNRKFAGLNAGLTSTFYKHLLLEAEGRMNFVELTKDPVFALIIRVGAVF